MSTRMPVAQRRAQLVDAAVAVAVQDGIAAATVRRIAEQAGVALGVVHYCFADKDELVSELAARIVADLARGSTAELRATLERGESTALAGALRAAVEGLWSGIERAPGAQLLTYEITTYALRNSDRPDVAGLLYDRSQAAVVEVLTAVAESSRSTWRRPVEDVAGETLAFIDGVTLRWLVDRDSAAARARLDSFVGYLARHARSRGARR